ncbi:MAG TPA: hypothetical protein VF600_04050 [Abditibacteriaceae bacterium]|jgi:hypothetical protein
MRQLDERTQSWLTRASVAALVSLFLLHFAFICIYAVDVPYWDEWTLLSPGQIPAGFSAETLWAPLNEHRIVTTKLLVWALYFVSGWNLIVHQILNFVIFGALVLLLLFFSRRLAASMPLGVITAFLLFLLSPLNQENHTMGIQTQFHLVLLFFLVAAYCLFHETQTWDKILAGVLATGLAMCSSAGGAVSALVLLMTFSLFKAQRVRNLADKGRKTEIAQWLLVMSVLGCAVTMWLVDYRGTAGSTASASPLSGRFWNYFFNIVSLGFGFEFVSSAVGVLCILVVVAPLIGMALKNRARLPANCWTLGVMVLGILAILASISVGRANGWAVDQSKSSRYSEFGMMLVPLAAMAWWQFVQTSKARTAMLLCLWCFCFAGFLNNWSYFAFYQDTFLLRTAGRECIRKYYDEGGGDSCRSVAPMPLASQLNAARKLNLSFYRSIRSESGADANMQQ